MYLSTNRKSGTEGWEESLFQVRRLRQAFPGSFFCHIPVRSGHGLSLIHILNGHVTQVHLCQDCAQAMGYTSALRRSMGPTSLFGDDFWSRPFSLLEPFMDSFGSRMLTEFPEPGQPEVLEQPVRQEKSAGLVDKAQQEALRYECKRNSLQERLKAAVESENYEEAARLRDELRALPTQP